MYDTRGFINMMFLFVDDAVLLLDALIEAFLAFHWNKSTIEELVSYQIMMSFFAAATSLWKLIVIYINVLLFYLSLQE